MHIAVLSDRYPLHPTGGAANVAASLAKRYRKQGHTVSVVTRSPNGEDRSIQKDGIRIYTIAAPELSSLQAYYSIYNPFILRSIRRIFSANDFDVVHAHNIHEFLSYHCLKIARKKSIPVVVTLHDAMSVSYGPIHQFINEMTITPGEQVPESLYRVNPLRQFWRARMRYFPLRNRLVRRYLNNYADMLVTVSKELARALRVNHIDVDTVIYNGVDVNEYAEGSPQAFRERFDVRSKRILLHGGRLSYRKGSEQVAKAFTKLAREDAELSLVLTGGSDYHEHMQAIAAPYADRITATGFIQPEILIDGYHAADVVASPSLYLEPFLLMNIEAMAAGTPPVTTCFGGPQEVVDDGNTGFVVNPLDVDELHDRIQALMNDSKRRTAMGSKGQTVVRSEFTLTQQVDQYLQIFERHTG